MTHAEGRQFLRSHCEDFVNKKNLRIGELRSGFCGSRSRCTARNASGGGDIIIIMLFEARGRGST